MRMEDMILISTDDHIVEPAQTFINHVPKKYLDQAPRVVDLENGQQRWHFVDRMVATPGGAAVAGRAKDELHSEPTRFEHMRKACYDVHSRIGDMNVNGILSSMNFPTFVGLGGELFLMHPDRNVMHVLVQAYNDFHIDEWCGAYPGRFIPLAIIPLWDPALAVAEIKRVARKGARAITFPENTTKFGLPSIHQEYWNPIWQACVDEDMTLAVHIGSGGGFRFPSLDSPMDVGMSTMNLFMAEFMCDIVFSPVLRSYPKLKLAISEGYMGWVPFLKERIDYIYEFHKCWSLQEFGDKKPSDYVAQNFLFCFTEDPTGVKNRHDIGIRHITFESDYPHADSTWPNSPERLWERHDFANIPENEIRMITHENAMQWFGFEPFKHIKKTEATVAALRAQATNVDMTVMSGGSAKPRPPKGAKVMTARDLAAMAKEFDLAPSRPAEAA